MEINSTQKKVIAAVGGLALGFVGGFAIGRYRARKEFLQNLDSELHVLLDEIEQEKQEALLRKDDFPTAQALFETGDGEVETKTPIFDDLVTQYGGHTLDELREVTQTEKPDEEALRLQELQEHLINGPIEPRNPQFPEIPDDDGISELDRSTRTLDHPFVISIDEFHEDDENQEKMTITWYTGGEEPVLADETNNTIDNIEYVIGEDNLQKFGMASSDPNIVYVRNLSNGVDYEVIRSKRSFYEVVYGVPEVPTNTPMRSMREGDDV